MPMPFRYRQSFNCCISVLVSWFPCLLLSSMCSLERSLLRVELASSVSEQPGLSVRNCSQNLSFTTAGGAAGASASTWVSP
uniref:Uncharacterized protein n=1 Tax=Arundo donax TaxID=35708 RepID=A0A0A9HLM9_ARUDO